VLLFLGSMLFTVFQYIPILEEEIHVSKTLNKNCNDSSPENDMDDDGDPDGDDTDELFGEDGCGMITLCSSLHKFYDSQDYLVHSLLSILTPPPKI
jgi:hypothetical protein